VSPVEWVKGFDRSVVAELRASARIDAWQERLHVAVPRAGWLRHAACRGLTALMFPPARTAGRPPRSGARQHPAEVAALAVCAGCPVRLACLGEARQLEVDAPYTDVHGIRGGLTVDQRVRVYRRIQPRPRSGCDLQPCGTEAAYMRHRYRDEPACRSCLEAHAARTADRDGHAGRRNHHARSA